MNDTEYWTATCLDCEEEFDGFYVSCPECESTHTIWTYEELN